MKDEWGMRSQVFVFEAYEWKGMLQNIFVDIFETYLAKFYVKIGWIYKKKSMKLKKNIFKDDLIVEKIMK